MMVFTFQKIIMAHKIHSYVFFSKRVMLINALRIIINKLYQESFNIIFMRKKKKNYQKNNYFIIFHKIFLKIVSKPIFSRSTFVNIFINKIINLQWPFTFICNG